MLEPARATAAKFTAAEWLLVSGYNEMKKRTAIIPLAIARLSEALQRILQLYEAWGKPDEAAKWRRELDAAKSGGKKGSAT
jgi:non-specific serine/threonine protein kinase/serine/threonine-protein kinase